MRWASARHRPASDRPADRGNRSRYPRESAVYALDDALLRWPLRAEDERYGAIDGRHLHTFVVEQWNDIRRANTFSAQFSYAGGSSRPALQDIAIRAFRTFGVPTYAAPEHGAPPGDLTPLWRFLPTVTTTDFNMYFHSDGERAYAMIIDKTNALPPSELQRPEEPAGR